MNNPAVSVIVPIYNVENYILESLKSMSAQTLKNIEFILINDGSTDGSKEIVEKFIKNDKRFKLYSVKNSGVSSARNFGIRKSSGEFIGFMDPDDWISEIMYEDMYSNAFNTNADIVSCGYIKSYKNSFEKISVYVNSSDNTKVFRANNSKFIYNLIGLSDKDFINAINQKKTNFFEGMIWRNLYSRKLIDINGITFNENLSYKEDEIFHLECSIKSSKIILLDNFHYYYRVRDESLTTKFKFDLFDLEFNIANLKKKIIKENFIEKDKENFNEYIDNKFLIDLIGIINNLYRNPKLTGIKGYKIAFDELKKISGASTIKFSNYSKYISYESIKSFVRSLYIYLIRKNQILLLFFISSIAAKRK